MARSAAGTTKRAAAPQAENVPADGDSSTAQQPPRRSTRQQSKDPSEPEPAASTAVNSLPKNRGRKRKPAAQDEPNDGPNHEPMPSVPEEADADGTVDFQGGGKDAKRLIKSRLSNLARNAQPQVVDEPTSVEQSGNDRGKKTNQRSLLDRQPNATRIEPIDPAFLQPGDGGDAANEPRTADDDNLIKQLAQANKQASGDTQETMQQGQLRAPTASMSQLGSSYPQNPFVEPSTGNLPASDPLDANYQESSAPVPASYESYMEVNRRAKEVTQFYKQDKVPQLRKAWEPAEIDRFIQLIGECGPSYSAIKSTDAASGNILVQRSHRNINKKKRNMKFDYLKSRVQLPEGFDKIVLDRKLRDKLEEMGILYEQHQVRKVR